MHICCPGHALQVGDALHGDLLHIDLREAVVLNFAGLGQMQELLNLARHVFDILEQRVAADAYLAQFDLRADQRERCLQFMRRRRKKLLLDAKPVLQPFEHAIEALYERHDFGRHTIYLESGMDGTRGNRRSGGSHVPQGLERIAQDQVRACTENNEEDKAEYGDPGSHERQREMPVHEICKPCARGKLQKPLLAGVLHGHGCAVYRHPVVFEPEISAFPLRGGPRPERFTRRGRHHGLAGGIKDAVSHLLPEALVHPVRTAFPRIEPDGRSRVVEPQCTREFFRASHQIGNEQEIAAHRQNGD
ncbi:hypothetical protein D3C87_1109550 [compost metagenome]